MKKFRFRWSSWEWRCRDATRKVMDGAQELEERLGPPALAAAVERLVPEAVEGPGKAAAWWARVAIPERVELQAAGSAGAAERLVPEAAASAV